MGFRGMDTAAVQALGRQLARQSSEVAAVMAEIEFSLEQTEWSGADRERFFADWTGQTRPAVRRASEILEDAARAAFEGAKRQEDASRDQA